jgi:hypothetical protein
MMFLLSVLLAVALSVRAQDTWPVPCGPMDAHNGTVHPEEYEYAKLHAWLTARVTEMNANASLDYAMAVYKYYVDYPKWEQATKSAVNVNGQLRNFNPYQRDANPDYTRIQLSKTFDTIGPKPVFPTRVQVTLDQVVSLNPDKPWAREMMLHKKRVDAWTATHFSAAQVYTVFNPYVNIGDAYFKNFSENVVLALLRREYLMSYAGPLWCSGRPVIPAWETLYRAHNESMIAFGSTADADDYEPHIERMEKSVAIRSMAGYRGVKDTQQP